jgi:hypothetical protein
MASTVSCDVSTLIVLPAILLFENSKSHRHWHEQMLCGALLALAIYQREQSLV